MGPRVSAPTPFFVALRRSSRTTRPGFNPCARTSPSAPPRPPAPAAAAQTSLGARPAPRRDDRHSAPSRRSPTPPRKGAESRTPSPRGLGNAVSISRNPSETPGRSGGEHVFPCNLSTLSPFAGRPFNGDECPPRYAQRPPLLFPPCCSKLSCQTLMQAVCIRI